MNRELGYLSDLECEDERISGEIASLDSLASEAEILRLRVLDVVSFLERLPDERERFGEEIDHLDRDMAAALTAHEQARVELAVAERDDNDERLAAALRFERRAGDLVSVVERKSAQARAEEKAFERTATKVESEVPGFTKWAARLAEDLSGRSRISSELAIDSPSQLADVAPWSERARAAILVARAGLATERDSIVRQANEVGSVILGEPLGTSSTSVVRNRVEGAVKR